MRAVNDASGQRIYLAGFDVFRLDAAEYGRGLQRACANFGFEGIYPLDAVAPANLAPRDKARWIRTRGPPPSLCPARARSAMTMSERRIASTLAP
jgi:Nucleoside 2-deoxyribosyltransferase